LAASRMRLAPHPGSAEVGGLSPPRPTPIRGAFHNANRSRGTRPSSRRLESVRWRLRHDIRTTRVLPGLGCGHNEAARLRAIVGPTRSDLTGSGRISRTAGEILDDIKRRVDRLARLIDAPEQSLQPMVDPRTWPDRISRSRATTCPGLSSSAERSRSVARQMTSMSCSTGSLDR